MKLMCLMATTGLALSVLAASFMHSLATYIIFYAAFFGLSIGIGYVPPFRNTFSYFPTRKGMCSGVCMMGYGIGSFAYNQVFLRIVNPNNMPADRDHFFPEEVADRFPTALLVLGDLLFPRFHCLPCLPTKERG